MQGRPALIVLPINIGSMLHQELNHVKIIIDAGLQKKKVHWISLSHMYI